MNTVVERDSNNNSSVEEEFNLTILLQHSSRHTSSFIQHISVSVLLLPFEKRKEEEGKK